MLIGLTGAAGAGKDTVADHLAGAHGFVKMSLAGPLYQMLEVMTGIPAARLANRAVKEAPVDWLGVSPRRLLQTLGTEWARDTVGEDVWIKHLFRRIDDFGAAAGFVITDVRFENEAQAMKARGGRIIEVVRPTPLHDVAEAARRHSSEAGIPDDLIDVTLVNDTDVMGLLSRVDAAVRWLHTDILDSSPVIP